MTVNEIIRELLKQPNQSAELDIRFQGKDYPINFITQWNDKVLLSIKESSDEI